MKSIGRLFFLISVLALITIPARAQGFDPAWQTSTLWNNEAQTVYLGNIAREEAGVPPLRWNKQLTYAARWFSWDTTENNSNKCTHTDTFDQDASQRAQNFGYLGSAGAENAFCGFATPAYAIQGWLKSGGHRDNLLDPNSREIGVGYYGSPSAGYVTQDFGTDPAYAPVVINNEAPSTESSTVELYIHNGQSDEWTGYGGAQDMQISSDRCFLGADWQPYQPRTAWTLPAGDPGWKTVYVRTRDANHRTRSASDVIYYGNPSAETMADDIQFSSTAEQVTLLGLDGGGLPLVQFSLGWQADDAISTFMENGGHSEHVADADAWGGTAYKMLQNGAGLWAYTGTFLRGIPLVAYARLKVDDNHNPGPVVDFGFSGGEYLSLRGTDFHQAGVYQEFALPFTFQPEQDWLSMNFSMRSSVNIYVDTVTFFTQPVPVQDPYTWAVPGGNYREQGIWVRYVNATLDVFSDIQEGNPYSPRLAVVPGTLHGITMMDEGNYVWKLKVLQVCSGSNWTATTPAAWLNMTREADSLRLEVSPTALGLGNHHATITVASTDDDSIAPVEIAIQVDVVEHQTQAFFPFSLK